jgi:hypothetical protein
MRGVVDQPVEDAVGQCGIAYLFVSPRDGCCEVRITRLRNSDRNEVTSHAPAKRYAQFLHDLDLYERSLSNRWFSEEGDEPLTLASDGSLKPRPCRRVV